MKSIHVSGVCQGAPARLGFLHRGVRRCLQAGARICQPVQRQRPDRLGLFDEQFRWQDNKRRWPVRQRTDYWSYPPRTEAGPHLPQLWTMQKFPKDFILKLEFRVIVNADSGLFIRQPQLQCRDYLVAEPFKELKKYRPQARNEIAVTVTNRVAHGACNGEVLEAALKDPTTGPSDLNADRGQLEYRRIRLQELP